jgi:Flp pilus assembly protein TadG
MTVPAATGRDREPDRAAAAGAGAERPGARQSDAGSAALELVVLAPVLLALIALVIAAGRMSIAQSSVDAAARDAARQASIALTPAAAKAAGRESADEALASDGLNCASEVVRVDTGGPDSGFQVPVGAPATVSATVGCKVPLSDLYLPGTPGSHWLWSTFYSPLDVYRAR